MKSSLRSRGFTTVVALVAVGLVGFTLTGLAIQLAADAHRTTEESQRAQLRQLIRADQLQSVRLPDKLVREGYSLAKLPTPKSR